MFGVVIVQCPDCKTQNQMLTGVGFDATVCMGCGAFLEMGLGETEPRTTKPGKQKTTEK